MAISLSVLGMMLCTPREVHSVKGKYKNYYKIAHLLIAHLLIAHFPVYHPLLVLRAGRLDLPNFICHSSACCNGQHSYLYHPHVICRLQSRFFLDFY
jgi:hypothetical protein